MSKCIFPSTLFSRAERFDQFLKVEDTECVACRFKETKMGLRKKLQLIVYLHEISHQRGNIKKLFLSLQNVYNIAVYNVI